MKVFFILQGSSVKKREAISLMSAFVRIDSIGVTTDLSEALEIIRQGHHDAPIFTSNVFNEKQRNILLSLLSIGRSVIILPKNYAVNSKCIYVGANIEPSKDLEWAIKAISQIILVAACGKTYMAYITLEVIQDRLAMHG